MGQNEGMSVTMAGESVGQGGGHNILMVSDFFYPNMGGVEMHLYQLAQCLIARGNKVVIVTHFYGKRKGVRWMTNGLKVYYIPLLPFYNGSTFPFCSVFWMPLLRSIIIREQIDIIHCHQAFSTLAHETLQTCSIMGYKTCFTDHSLFGFADASSIHMNKLLKFSLSAVNHVICVSNTSKENTVLRAELDPLSVSVIPNAVDCTSFKPDPSNRNPDKITIVVISRLVYRKGMDLLIDVIPPLCRKYPNLEFIIGGDGPKRIGLEEMREKHQLHDRVELLGSIPHAQVRDVLVRGQIFLNCSLTEAFCIAIVEAASCGLLIVSTKVGGVPEVPPSHMNCFAQPNAEDLERAIDEAIPLLSEVQPFQFHEEVKRMYNWHTVAERTEIVYGTIAKSEPDPLIQRFGRYYSCGAVAGKIFCCLISIYFLWWCFIEWWYPKEEIDIAPTFPYDTYMKNRKKSSN